MDKFKDEVDFWMHQIMEHCEMISLGVLEPRLQRKAKELKEEWDVDEITVDDILDLIKKTRELKEDCLERLENREWIGWLYPAFFKHTLLELQYFEDKVNGKEYTKIDEANFWNKIAGDHAKMSAHLLDLSEESLVSTMFAIGNFSDNAPLTIDEVKQNIEELLKLHKEAKIDKPLSIIPPMLLKHDIREEERALKCLN